MYKVSWYRRVSIVFVICCVCLSVLSCNERLTLEELCLLPRLRGHGHVLGNSSQPTAGRSEQMQDLENTNDAY
jgi:hypothetical protein